MANQNLCDMGQSDRRRLKNGMYAYAMGDGYRNPDFQRKLQLANKKIQAEDDIYSTGDEMCDYRAGDRLVYKQPPSQQHTPQNPRCDFRIHGDVPYVERYQQQGWKYPVINKAEIKPRPSTQPKTQLRTQPQFEHFKEKFMQTYHLPEKLPEPTIQDKNEFMKECCEVAMRGGFVEKNSKGEHLLKPQFRPRQAKDSEHSDGTYTNHQTCGMHSPSDFTDQESSEEKAKRPVVNNRGATTVTIKPSARSNNTSRSKKAEELVNLQRLKSDIIEVIQDGIQKIEKNTSEKPSAESQNVPNSQTSITNQNTDVLQSDVLTTFVKQLRDNHLGNILHEVKNLHFLESLPERCQNDLNKKREF